MTIDITQSMSVAKWSDEVNTMAAFLLGYDRVYFVAGEDTIDVYGERLENDEEYSERVELETSYRVEVSEWLKETAHYAVTK